MDEVQETMQEETQEITVSIPVTPYSEVVTTRVTAQVPSGLLPHPDIPEPTEGIQAVTMAVPLATDTAVEEPIVDEPEQIDPEPTFEDQVREYVQTASRYDELVTLVKSSVEKFIPADFRLTEFISISMAQGILASEFIKEQGGEVSSVSTWDTVTQIEVPILQHSVSTLPAGDLPTTVVEPEEPTEEV